MSWATGELTGKYNFIFNSGLPEVKVEVVNFAEWQLLGDEWQDCFGLLVGWHDRIGKICFFGDYEHNPSYRCLPVVALLPGQGGRAGFFEGQRPAYRQWKGREGDPSRDGAGRLDAAGRG